MNNQFYITLKRVTTDRNDNKDVVETLWRFFLDLQRYLKSVSISTKSEMQPIENFCINLCNEIKLEKYRIEQILKDYVLKIGNSLNEKDIHELSLQIEYYSEILNIVSDAIWELIRYLIYYFPEDCTSDEFIQEVQEALPTSDIVALRFLEKYKPRYLRLKEGLSANGFFNLGKTKILNEQQQNQIVIKLADENIPFWIDLFDYVGYLDYFEELRDAGKLSREQRNILIQKWYNPAADHIGDNVKKAINSRQWRGEKQDKAIEFYKNLIK